MQIQASKCLSVLAIAGLFASVANAQTIVEDYQFNDVAGTEFSALVNDADGSASLGGDLTGSASADGAGNLVVTNSASGNLFRNSSPARGINSGIYTVEVIFSAADFSDPAATNTNFGIGVRGADGSSDLVLRVAEDNSGNLDLVVRYFDGTSNTNQQVLRNFVNAPSFSGTDAVLSAVIDFDANTAEVTGTFGAESNTESITLGSTVDFDTVRTSAGASNYGATDSVSVNSFRITTAAGVLLGDCNQDGDVDFSDISPFIAVLSGGGFLAEADCNESGDVDFQDISPFIAILSGS